MAFQYGVPEFAARQQALEKQSVADQAAIERRRRIAEAMMASSQAPIDIPSAGQGRPAPIHPLQGIAKLVEAYMAKQRMGEAEKAGSDFASKKAQDEAAILADYGKARESEIDKIRQGFMPTPAAPMPAAELGGGPYRPEIPKTIDEQRAAFQQSQLSEFPEARRFGEVQQRFIESDEAARIAREDKAQAAKLAAEEKANQARIAAQERLERDRMIAGLKGSTGAMSPVAQRELIESDEAVAGSLGAISSLKQALDINDKAMGFAGAGMVSSAGTLLPKSIRPEAIDATQNLDNILQSSALPQLKAIFGGMPTEGERKVLLEIQGSSSKPPSVRKEIFERAIKAAETRMKFNEKKAAALREGKYFSPENPNLNQAQPNSFGAPPPGAVRRKQ